MKNEKELKEMLVGMELDLLELDNKMMENGYYTIFDEGILEEVLREKSAVYLAVYLNVEDNETQILVTFEVLILADATVESLGASYIKIVDVEKM